VGSETFARVGLGFSRLVDDVSFRIRAGTDDGPGGESESGKFHVALDDHRLIPARQRRDRYRRRGHREKAGFLGKALCRLVQNRVRTRHSSLQFRGGRWAT